MKPLRTAILGCGHFARKHVVHLAGLEEISLVGFCDALFESANNYNQEFAQGKGQVFTDYEQLFTGSGIGSGIYLPSPICPRK